VYDFTLFVVFFLKIKNTLFSSLLFCSVLFLVFRSPPLHKLRHTDSIFIYHYHCSFHLYGFHSPETMKHTGKFHYPPLSVTSHDSDLRPRPKPKTPKTTTRFKKFKSSSNGKRSRPETPLLKWKIHDKINDSIEEKEKPSSPAKLSRRTGRNVKKQTELGFSARRLAAGLWRLQQPEMVVGGNQKRFGFQVKFKPFWVF